MAEKDFNESFCINYFVIVICDFMFFQDKFVATSLKKDHNGLGFSISGGKSKIPSSLNEEVSSNSQIITFCNSLLGLMTREK